MLPKELQINVSPTKKRGRPVGSKNKPKPLEKIKELQIIPTFSCRSLGEKNIIRVKFGDRDSYGTEIANVISPTGNCQLSSIRDFKNLLVSTYNWNRHYYQFYKKDKLVKYVPINEKELLYNFFKLVYASTKKIVLIDLQDCYCDKIESLVDKKFIILKKRYVSTNNSKMCIYLINILGFISNNRSKFEPTPINT